MRRLWLLSSFILVLTMVSSMSCKVKKSIEDSLAKENPETELSKNNSGVIHAPGTIDQKKLDSIKAIRMKEKLKKD